MQQEQKNIEVILNEPMIVEKIDPKKLFRENATVGGIALVMLILGFFGEYIGMDLFGRIFLGCIGFFILLGLNGSMNEPDLKTEKKELP
ncbi:MAG: hypothetical protein WC839_03100 [Candidatus Paceibacterota bacterium]